MLELIDQSNPDVPRYRCDQCGADGTSSVARAADGYFFIATKTPGPIRGRYVVHVCDPVAVARFQAPPPAVALADEEPEAPSAPKRGRPRKSEPVTE